MSTAQKNTSRALAFVGILVVVALTVFGGYGLKRLYSSDDPAASGRTPTSNDRFVVATVPHIASWLENILPDTITIKVLATGDAHDFALTPQTISATENASAIVANGAGLEEAWLPEIAAAAPSVPIIETAGDAVIVGDDPHTWLDPLTASQQVDLAARELAKLIPTDATDILEQARRYRLTIERLDEGLQEQRSQVESKSFVALHDAFGYFARRYDLAQVGELVERPGDSPTFADIQSLSQTIADLGITTIFVEPGAVPDVVRAIAQELDLTIATLDTLESLDPKAEAYEDAMLGNAEALFGSLR
ncbi:MAG: metal ABC transporter substrate-binding protein [bacterium]|nr:metal ABC transporter substrate-binding protein [bacterium]